MAERVGRRAFMGRIAGGAASGMIASSVVRAGQDAQRADTPDAPRADYLKKALLYSMLPASMDVGERFRLAADLGFEGVEVQTVHDESMVGALRSAADQAGVRIHSVMNSESWKHPLSSPDPAVVEEGHRILRTSLHEASALGADAVLLIPAVVTPEVRYADAWRRSQREIRRVLPLARELGVTIAIENVGNRFLLSPLEFARYVDELSDPFLRAYFDVGNSRFLWSYPQDWLLTLGHRIARLHLKDCDFEKKRFVLLMDGDVDWDAVREGLRRIHYRGYLTVEPNYRSPELERGDVDYLREISRRVDRILGRS